MIGRPVLAHCRQNAERNADSGAEQDREGGELDRRRHHPRDVVRHRPPGPQRIAEVSGGDVAEIARELHVDRLVHAELFVDLLVGRLVGFLANDGPDRIDGHQPADGEGQDEQADQGDEDRAGLSDEGHEPGGGQSHRIVSRAAWRGARPQGAPRGSQRALLMAPRSVDQEGFSTKPSRSER
jgi:hypothetical protein